jgi:hypothetical protein
MRRVVVTSNVTLDGVMQAPGRPDEDLRGGFPHGGWALPYNDSVKGKAMAEGMAQAGPLLFGRRRYEDFFRVWPTRKDNPFTEVLDNARKYAASTTLNEPLPWASSCPTDPKSWGYSRSCCSSSRAGLPARQRTPRWCCWRSRTGASGIAVSSPRARRSSGNACGAIGLSRPRFSPRGRHWEADPSVALGPIHP